MAPHQIGIGVQSFVGHDLDDIRKAVVELASDDPVGRLAQRGIGQAEG